VRTKSSAITVVLSGIFALAASAGSVHAEVTARVERRFVEKRGHFSPALGFVYLARGDYYRNPGAQLSLGYWWRESVALELQAAVFAAVEGQEIEEIRVQTGFLPDARRERAIFAVGPRFAFGYGKMLVGRRIIHFDPQLFAHVGTHVTENRGLGPMVDFGLGLAVRPTRRLEVRFDLALLIQAEERTRWEAVLGFAPMLGLGALL
jgi:hypothetical protein